MRIRLRIKDAAKEKRISLTKLSQRSEVSYNTIKILVHNPYSDVRIYTLARLAEVLGVPVAALFDEINDEQAEAEIAAIKSAMKARKKSAP